MKKYGILLFLSLFLLAGCSPAPAQGGHCTILATTYPIYLLTSAITQNAEGVQVERLNTGSVSCLHDYTLSVNDMKKLEQADIIAQNGAGLEEFLEDALETSRAQVIDCSQGIPLLENLSHHHEEEDGHDHDHGHWDPHYWMDPANAMRMVETLCSALARADPDNAAQYEAGAQEALEQLRACQEDCLALWEEAELPPENTAELITFHDGFQYFAHAFGFPLLASIEEEAGSEASAKEIVEMTHLIQEHGIPVIFTETNGSDATAKAIARETGCQVAQLTMVMDGPDSCLDHYLEGLKDNVKTIVRGFAGNHDRGSKYDEKN